MGGKVSLVESKQTSKTLEKRIKCGNGLFFLRECENTGRSPRERWALYPPQPSPNDDDPATTQRLAWEAEVHTTDVEAHPWKQ